MTALDPATLAQRQGIGGEDIPSLHEPPVERHANNPLPSDPSDRPDERDEDERDGVRVVLEENRKIEGLDQIEDDTDVAIKLARGHAIECVQFLAGVLVDLAKSTEDRSRAAIALLEVAGCL